MDHKYEDVLSRISEESRNDDSTDYDERLILLPRSKNCSTTAVKGLKNESLQTVLDGKSVQRKKRFSKRRSKNHMHT